MGEHYLASGWKQELMTMLEFLKRIQASGIDCSERPYLAQHPLFEQVIQILGPTLFRNRRRELIMIKNYFKLSFFVRFLNFKKTSGFQTTVQHQVEN